MRRFLRHLSPSHDQAPAAERVALARSIGALALPASLVAAVWALLPTAPAADVPLGLALMAVAGVLGYLFYTRAETGSPAMLALLLAGDTWLIGFGIHATGAPMSPTPLYFMWAAPIAFALYGPGHAMLHAVNVALTYGVVLALLPADPSTHDLTAWTAVTTTVLVLGLGVRRVMSRFREVDERYRRGFQDASVGMALVGTDVRFLQVNDALCRFLDRPADVLLGTSPIQWTVPDDVPATLDLYRRPEGGQLDKRFLRPDGSIVWGRVTRSPVRDARRRVLYHVHQIEDVTARRRGEEERRAAAEAVARRARLSDASAAIGRLAVEVTAPDELARRICASVADCLGASACSVLEQLPDGRTLRVLASSERTPGRVPGNDIVPAPGTLTALSLQEREPVAIEDVHRDPRLEPATVLGSAGLSGALTCALRRPGETLGLIGAFTDAPRTWEPEESQFMAVVAAMLASAIERSRSEADARRRALHDPLTGLPNRALFLDRLSSALTRARRSGEAPAVLLLDLDGFKVVNDSLGHHAGDELLRAIAPRLQEAIRACDTVARLGGDEFVVLAEAVPDEATALEVAGRLDAALRRPVPLHGSDLHLSASIGVAIGAASSAPDALLRDADAAMYHAKRRGRGRVELFGAPLRDEALRRLELEQDLRRALERDELALEFQPVVDLPSGRVVSCEALLRWAHPERGRVAPDEFIGIAEESGLILPMGRWVLQAACEEAMRWPSDVGVAVNLSGRQVADPELCGHVLAVLADTGLSPSRLTLEITESTLMEEAEAPLRTLTELRAMGIRLALDDFGTGYSSLSYLRRFALDCLKVDRSFVRDLDSDPHAIPLVEAVVAMAGALGLDVVAEGIETEEHRERLLALGCAFGQGYHLGRPLGPAAVRERLGAATIPA